MPIPIAVKKISYGEFEQSLLKNKYIQFALSDENSMRTEIKLSDFFEVLISARLSLSGRAKPQNDDLRSNISLVKNGDMNVTLRLLKSETN